MADDDGASTPAEDPAGEPVGDRPPAAAPAPGTFGWGRIGPIALVIVLALGAGAVGAAIQRHHGDEAGGEGAGMGMHGGWGGGHGWWGGRHGGWGHGHGGFGGDGDGMYDHGDAGRGGMDGGPDMAPGGMGGGGMGGGDGGFGMGGGGPQRMLLQRALKDHLGVTDARLRAALLASVDDLLKAQEVTKEQAAAMRTRIKHQPSLLTPPATPARGGA